MESPLKKKRRRYYNERKREFAALNAKYTPIFRSLCCLQGDFLDYNDYQNAAWEYADKRARANLTWYQSIISGNGANMIINIVLLVVNIALCFTPAAPAGAAGIGAVIANTTSAVVSVVLRTISIVARIVGALANFVSSIISQHYSFKTEGLAGLAQGKSGASEAYKRREQAEQQRNTLTALMVFGGYSIYAGGEVYNQHSAGTQTYNALTPLDTTKGIRGDIQQESELSKMIHTRTGADMAGGENYTANVLNLPFPLQKFGFGSAQIQDGLVNRYLNIVKTLNNAFVELNNLDINADGKAQTLYNNKLSKLTSQTEHALYSDDFLNKMKNYSRGMMADFTYKNRNFFNPREKSSFDFRGALKNFDFNEVMNSDADSQTKANYYLDLIIMLFDFLEFFASEMGYFYYTCTYGWDDPGGDNASGGWMEEITKHISVFKKEPHKEITNENKTERYEWYGDDKIYIYDYTYTKATKITNEYGAEFYVITDKFKSNKYYEKGNVKAGEIIAPFEDFSEFHFLDNYFYKDTNKTLDGNEIIKLYEQFLACFFRINGKGYFVVANENFSFKEFSESTNLDGSTSYSWNTNILYKEQTAKRKNFVIPIDDESYNIFTKKLELPSVLSAYNFSKLTKTIKNSVDETDEVLPYE